MTKSPELLSKVENSIGLEQLIQDVNETKKSLDALKQEKHFSEKQKKKEEIKTQISILKSKISEALQKETDEVKKQKILELQQQLESTGMELSGLEQEIVDKQEAGTSVEEEQGLWDKTKDFVSENFTAVTTAESWKKETGMNILRSTGFAAAAYAARSAVKGAWNRMFWDDEEEKKDKKSESEDSEAWEKKEKTLKDEEVDNNKDQSSKKGLSWWKKALIWVGGAWASVLWWTWVYKNWDRIKWRFWDLLGENLTMEESIEKVEAEVRNGRVEANKTGVFYAHFDGIHYNKETGDFESYGEKIKVDAKSKTIEGLDLNFPNREELFHAANIVNFMRSNLKWLWANQSPFGQTSLWWDISFNFSNTGRQRLMTASNSDEWKYLLWLAWWTAGGILGWYCWGVKWSVAWVGVGGASGALAWSALDNDSSLARACQTIKSWVNFDKFLNFLNRQIDQDSKSLWIAKKEKYEDLSESPLHAIGNKVQKDIDDAYGIDKWISRAWNLDQDPQDPSRFILNTYGESISIKIEWNNVIKDGKIIDYTNIKAISLWKYSENDWGNGLQLDFPHDEKGLEEVLRIANLTNKIRREYMFKGAEMYPFSYGTYKIPFNFNFDFDTIWIWWIALLSQEALEKNFPTLLKDLKQQNKLSKQESLHDQAKQDKKEGCSQYIKYLHQMRNQEDQPYWKSQG